MANKVIIRSGSEKSEISRAFAKLKTSRSFNPDKYFGVLKLKENPLDLQKKWRDEWR